IALKDSPPDRFAARRIAAELDRKPDVILWRVGDAVEHAHLLIHAIGHPPAEKLGRPGDERCTHAEDDITGHATVAPRRLEDDVRPREKAQTLLALRCPAPKPYPMGHVRNALEEAVRDDCTPVRSGVVIEQGHFTARIASQDRAEKVV